MGSTVFVEAGREAVKEANGVRLLYTTSMEALDSREQEGIIFLASVIMRKCFPRSRLPLPTLRSTITCSLPDSDFHTIDMGEGQGVFAVQSSVFVYLNVF